MDFALLVEGLLRIRYLTEDILSVGLNAQMKETTVLPEKFKRVASPMSFCAGVHKDP